MIDRAVGLSSTPSALTTFTLSQHSVHWCHLCCAWLTWARWIWLYLFKCICKDDLIRSRCKMSLLAYLNACVNVWFPYNVTFKEMWSFFLITFPHNRIVNSLQTIISGGHIFFLMMENPFFPRVKAIMTVVVFKCSHGSGGFGETRGIRAVIQMRPAAGRCEANIRESIEVYYGDSTGGWETTTKCDRETHL